MNNIAIIACARREELYIKEWLDWYINMGFDHFFIADNNDKEYKPKLKDVIQEYIDKGIVDIYEFYNVKKSPTIQVDMYDNMYQKHRYEYDWFLCVDIDEFLTLPKYNDNIKLFIDNIPKYIDLISFLWRYYDDNNLVYYDDRKVNERFTNPAKKQALIFKKTMFRSICINKIKDQHTITNTKDYRCYDVTLKNNITNTSNMRINGIILPNNQEKYLNYIYSIGFIKHFAYKTLEEYSWKINRGDVLFNKNDNNFPLQLSKFWEINNVTEEKKQLYEKLRQNGY